MMKFCSKTSGGCTFAASMKGSRVRLAADRDPVDASKIDNVLRFLVERLSEEDYAKVTDLLDDAIDDAESANPSAAMDGMSADVRRITRRASRSVRLGKAGKARTLASDGLAYDARFPHSGRLGAPAGGAIRPARSLAMDTSQRQAFDDRFPNAGRLK